MGKATDDREKEMFLMSVKSILGISMMIVSMLLSCSEPALRRSPKTTDASAPTNMATSKENDSPSRKEVDEPLISETAELLKALEGGQVAEDFGNSGWGRKMASDDQQPQIVRIGMDIDLTKAAIETGLAPEFVTSTVNNHLSELYLCFEKALANKGAQSSGALKFRFEVVQNGSVEGAVLEKSSFTDNGLSECFLTAFKRWKFSSEDVGNSGSAVTVELNFDLSYEPNSE